MSRWEFPAILQLLFLSACTLAPTPNVVTKVVTKMVTVAPTPTPTAAPTPTPTSTPEPIPTLTRTPLIVGFGISSTKASGGEPICVETDEQGDYSFEELAPADMPFHVEFADLNADDHAWAFKYVNVSDILQIGQSFVWRPPRVKVGGFSRGPLPYGSGFF